MRAPEDSCVEDALVKRAASPWLTGIIPSAFTIALNVARSLGIARRLPVPLFIGISLRGEKRTRGMVAVQRDAVGLTRDASFERLILIFDDVF